MDDDICIFSLRDAAAFVRVLFFVLSFGWCCSVLIIYKRMI